MNAAGAALLTAMVIAQVASGLRPDDLRLTSAVVVLLAGTALAFAAADAARPGRSGPAAARDPVLRDARRGLPAATPAGALARALTAFGGAAAAGYAAEWIGVRNGVPFGDYRYTGVLWPAIGGVPLIVALAWGGMGLAAHAVAREIAPLNRPARLALGACALTAWDLFLDPQMMRLGLWTWAEQGPYRGVPFSNFAGWLLVSLLVMWVIDRVAGRTAGARTGLITLYTVMAIMETAGFAAVFRPPDPLVATAGGIAMGAFALLAWERRWRK